MRVCVCVCMHACMCMYCVCAFMCSWMYGQVCICTHVRENKIMWWFASFYHQTNKSSALPEELYKLRHKVRVLEKSLENERTLSAEFYNDLCQLEQKHWKLGKEEEGWAVRVSCTNSNHLLFLLFIFLIPFRLFPSYSSSSFSTYSTFHFSLSLFFLLFLIFLLVHSAEADFQVAQRSVEEVQQLKDIQEELDVKSCALEKTEKTLQR